MAPVLQEELLMVPGIAGAEVDDDRGIAGVRVQLAEGADADAVGVAVRRILVEHGMRPSPSDDEAGGEGPPPPPGAPGSVVSFPLIGAHAEAVSEEPTARQLESVAVEETPDGVSVLVRTTDGTRVSRRLDPAGHGMDEAVVAAVGELSDHAGLSVLGVSEAEFGSDAVITVLVALGDSKLSGSAVQRGGRAYAVARATWSALEKA